MQNLPVCSGLVLCDLCVNSFLFFFFIHEAYGCAGAGFCEGAGLFVSKFTLGACRAPSSVLKYASLRVNPARLATKLFGNSEI